MSKAVSNSKGLLSLTIIFSEAKTAQLGYCSTPISLWLFPLELLIKSIDGSIWRFNRMTRAEEERALELRGSFEMRLPIVCASCFYPRSWNKYNPLPPSSGMTRTIKRSLGGCCRITTRRSLRFFVVVLQSWVWTSCWTFTTILIRVLFSSFTGVPEYTADK